MGDVEEDIQPSNSDGTEHNNQPSTTRSSLFWFHVIVACVVMLSGLLLISLGFYLRVVNPLFDLGLSYTENASIDAFLSISYLAIYVGTVLLMLAMFGACVTKTGLARGCAIAFYMIFLFLSLGILMFISVLSLMLSGQQAPLYIDEKLERAWIATVTHRSEQACIIQYDFSCYGFTDGLCAECSQPDINGEPRCPKEKLAQCPKCTGIATDTQTGCYSAIIDSTKKVHRPLGITSIIVMAVLILDAVVVCSL